MVIRLCFVLGNMTWTNDSNRTLIVEKYSGLTILTNLLIKYYKRSQDERNYILQVENASQSETHRKKPQENLALPNLRETQDVLIKVCYHQQSQTSWHTQYSCCVAVDKGNSKLGHQSCHWPIGIRNSRNWIIGHHARCVMWTTVSLFVFWQGVQRLRVLKKMKSWCLTLLVHSPTFHSISMQPMPYSSNRKLSQKVCT